MKKLIPVVALIALTIGCVGGTPPDADHGIRWDKIKSPSGRCYEVASWGAGAGQSSRGFSFAGVIPCSEME